MPVLLSRIEREYVVKILEERLPALSLRSEAKSASVPEKTYTLFAGTVTLNGLFTTDGTDSEVRVCFLHKQRGMFFDSILQKTSQDAFFKIPESIYMEESQSLSVQAVRFQTEIDGVIFKAIPVDTFPLDAIMIDSAVAGAKKTTFRKISGKSGIGDPDSLAVFRLYEYLDSFGTNAASGLSTIDGHLFFIDHRHILVSIRSSVKKVKGVSLFVSLSCDKRTISIDAVLSGSIPVTAALTVLCLDISGAQEEDKRFLYERLYRKKYS